MILKVTVWIITALWTGVLASLLVEHAFIKSPEVIRYAIAIEVTLIIALTQMDRFSRRREDNVLEFHPKGERYK